MDSRPEDAVVVPSALAHLRRFAMDGALYLFDRRTGLSAICDGPETAHLRMRAPRVVQFAITNACNLACTFCSRDVDAASAWTPETALTMLRGLSLQGTLEVAFGGGEPLVFKGFTDLVRRLFEETELAIGITTNGTRLSDSMTNALAPYAGQIRVSIYDDVDHRPILRRLAARNVRFGVNWLITPQRLEKLDALLFDLLDLGCRDVLLLSYNGQDPSMHLAPEDTATLAHRIRALARGLGGRMQLKLDVCWGDRMQSAPRLFGSEPCPAGRDFVVISSDKRLAPCSFHHRSHSIDSADDVLRIWNNERAALATPARDPGCARTPDFGLGQLGRRLLLFG